ncbi:MAG: ATP-binding protein [Bacteroidota bacterium]
MKSNEKLHPPGSDRQDEISGEADKIRFLEDEIIRLQKQLEIDRRNAGQISLLIQKTPIIILHANAAGTVIAATGYSSMFKGPAENFFLDKNLLEIFSDPAEAAEAAKEALNGNYSKHSYPRGDFYYETWFSPVLDSEGKPDGALTISVNITDKAETERNLALVRRYSEVAFEAGKLGYWERDFNTGKILWTETMYRIYNRNRYDDQGKEIPILYLSSVHGDDFEEVSAELNKSIYGTENEYQLEYRVLLPDDVPPKYVRVEGKITRNADGSPAKVFGIVQDITVLKIQQNAALRAKDRLNSILSSIRSGFFAVNCNWDFVYINRQAERNFRRRGIKLQGTNIWDIFPDARSTEAWEKLNMVMTNRVSARFEYYYEALSRWFDINAYPSEDGLSVMMTDIDDRKRLEIELKQINKTKDRFFSIIAHDLRNPLSAIIALTELASNPTFNNSPEKLTEYMRYLNHSAKNVNKLLDNLMQWARLQMNEYEIKAGIFEIKKLAEFNMELFEPVAREKGISLKMNLETGARFKGDKDMADTVLRNLISNAVKFTGSGGSITVNCQTEGAFLKVSVIDTGTGMPAPVLETLFDLDTRNSVKGTSGETGTGFGLKLCREMCEKNGGTIYAESTLGKGSTFHFTLPNA